MPDDRRNRAPGGTFFFTVNLANRRSDLSVRDLEPLRAAVAKSATKRISKKAVLF
jgi:putative transposase